MKKKRFTKKDFVEILYEQKKEIITSKIAAEEVMNLFIKIFQFALTSNYTIEVRGLGTFSIKTIPERNQAWNINKNKLLLNNNHKEKIIKLPKINSISYKPSITLRKKINEKKTQDESKKNEVKNGSKPASTSLNHLENATKEEINKALNLLLDEAKSMTKKDEFN